MDSIKEYMIKRDTARKLEYFLVQKYGYKKLPIKASKGVRDVFTGCVPKCIPLCGSSKVLVSDNGSVVSNGFKRVVVGDYGAFIEFDKEQANKKDFIVKKGEEFRLDLNFNGKYIWLCHKNDIGLKIYYQIRTVPYADYKKDNFYIDVYSVGLK